MRTTEAVRYARWAALAAGLTAAIVLGFYLERSVRVHRAERNASPAVPPTVQQRSAEFSFSKMEGNRTLFTIRASRATQFKDENRSLLEDVWITIYGREGRRNDNIHTRECSYEPKTGAVRCEGEVQIDLEEAGDGNSKKQTLEVATRDLSFDRSTGEAKSPAAVTFRFPGGQGSAVGVAYDTRKAVVRLARAINLELAPSERTGGLPVRVTGSRFEFRRNEGKAILAGPAEVQQGPRTLEAKQISVELDSENRVRRVIAEGQPTIRVEGVGVNSATTAGKMAAVLGPDGWIERIELEGGVTGERQAASGKDSFRAGRVEFAMQSRANQVREMIASGGVAAESQQPGESRLLQAESLRLSFAPAGRGASPRITTAETLSPARIQLQTSQEGTTLDAAKFAAEFGGDGRLARLLGHSGVKIRRQVGNGTLQQSNAAELAATFDAQGEWATLEEIGNVQLAQSDRQATAAHARIVRATDTMTLDGSPVISDSRSRTTAAAVEINQRTGELRATGGVISTYFSAAPSSPANLGSGPVHISADMLTGSSTAGRAAYTGRARLWQGDSVVDADRIEIWRDQKSLEATGHVVAVFAEASSPFSKSQGPTLWRIRAPALHYWSEERKARLEGGVVAESQQGSLESKTLDVFLSPPGTPPASGKGASASQLSRAVARGGVVVSQGDRRGTAEQAEYTATDGKFVLSGGNPTLTDASRDTTTGGSLTFFVANDTILIDSEEGSRTLTKHRIEK